MTWLAALTPWECICAAFVLCVAGTVFAHALVKR